MGDPLFNNGVNLAVVLIVLLKTIVVFVGAAGVRAAHDLVRAQGHRLHAEPQRPEPGRPVRPAPVTGRRHQGLLQGGVPPGPSRQAPLRRWRPYLSLVPAFIAFSVVPFGGTFTIAHHTTRLQLVDPPWGILVVLMMSSIAVYGVMLAGWSSGSKYPLLGSVRASAQMVSYEAALGLSVVTVVLLTGNLRTSAIVASQHGVVPRPLEHHPGGRHPVLHLPDRRHRRDEPAALRPGRSRGGDRRRLHGRVLRHRLRLLLPGRVRQRHHQLGHHRDPVSRRPRRPEDRRSQHRDHLVPPQGVRLPLHLRVVPGHPAPFPLRPAHGSGLEAADPRVARLAADRGRLPSRQRLVGRAHGRARDLPAAACFAGPWPWAGGPLRSRPRTERAA